MAGFRRFAPLPRAITAPLTVTAIGFVEDSTVSPSLARAASAPSLFSFAADVSGSKVTVSVEELPSKSESPLLRNKRQGATATRGALKALISLRDQSRKRRAR